MSAQPRTLPIRLLEPGPKQDAADHAFASGGRSAIPAPPSAFVFVNGEPISEAAIGREMQHHPAMRPEDSRQAAIEALVIERLLALEARRQGIDGQAVAEPGESAEEAAIRVLIEPLMRVMPADEASCRRYFEAHREAFRAPDRLRLRHILLAASPDDIAARLAQRDHAEILIAELKQHPERFAEFAQRHSACSSRDQGGDLEWIQRGDTTAEFERQVFRLHPGLAGLPVESRWGYHVVSVDQQEKGAALDFDQVASEIATRLDLQQRQSALKHYVESLIDHYPVAGLDTAERNTN